MTLPDRLRPVLKDDRNLWKVVMDSAIKALNDTLSRALRKEILAGAIVVLHPFGRHLGFNPHIHLLITEGGFDKSRKFIHKKKTMSVYDFIHAIIQHVPERQFKMIRYYGAYCRKWKSKYRGYLSHSSIKQCKIDENGDKSWPRCPNCGSRLQFVRFFKKGPPIIPEKRVFGTKLDDWNYFCASYTL